MQIFSPVYGSDDLFSLPHHFNKYRASLRWIQAIQAVTFLSMSWPLLKRVPSRGDLSPDRLLSGFLDYVSEKNLELYPAQEEAILALFDGKNVILNTPTGSGKSLEIGRAHV